MACSQKAEEEEHISVPRRNELQHFGLGAPPALICWIREGVKETLQLHGVTLDRRRLSGSEYLTATFTRAFFSLQLEESWLLLFCFLPPFGFVETRVAEGWRQTSELPSGNVQKCHIFRADKNRIGLCKMLRRWDTRKMGGALSIYLFYIYLYLSS